MAKNELFLFDALSAVGRAVISKVPKNFTVKAWTNRAVSQATHLPQNVTLNAVSLDMMNNLVREVSSATHVVFAVDAFYKSTDDAYLVALSDTIRKCYDACNDEKTRAFVFISTAAVYRDSTFSVDENAPVEGNSATTRTALEIEEYLLNASANRTLKPIILRTATPYGRFCSSIAYLLFQQITFCSTIRTTVPRFYKGPRCPLAHVDDIASAIFHLMSKSQLNDQVFNLADDECMRVGELFAIAAQTVELPEYTKIVLPHALDLPVLLKALQRMGLLKAIDEFVAKIWKKISFCYGIEDTPAPSVSDLVTASAWPKISSLRLEKTGFVLEHASFRTSAQELYAQLRDDYWLPDFSKQPCRPDALINRVCFSQLWKGFIIDQQAPNESMPLEICIDNNMPIWATHSFSDAPLRGSFAIGVRPKISFEGTRVVKHLGDICWLSSASFTLVVDQKTLTFAPIASSSFFKTPYQKFSLVDEAGRVRYTGKVTLDLSPNTVINCIKTMNFGARLL